MSKNAFKLKVNEVIKKAAFDWLMSKRAKIHSKGSEINYNYLNIQDYFLPANMNVTQCNLLFALRARMAAVKCNFRNKYDDLTCPVCMDSKYEDTQLHLLDCKTLLSGTNILVRNNICYNDIYSSDIQKQERIVGLFEDLFSKRRKFIIKKDKIVQCHLIDPSDPNLGVCDLDYD